MERFYSWRDIRHCIDQGTVETLVICYNSFELAVENVYHDIENALKSCGNLPDCVYIIGSSSQYATFKDAWLPSSDRRENMLRRGVKLGIDFVKQYTFLEWQQDHFTKHTLGSTTELYRHDPKHILTRGVFSLLEKNDAIHQAPSGHTFKHPSGAKNKVFIQARDIASDEAELYVVGYAIALSYGIKLRDAKKVLIDTMGIYAYVKNALDLCLSQAEILSFHSYNELEILNPPTVPYFCIVSASTSGRMASTMVMRQFAGDRIATIVDTQSIGRCGDVIVPLDSMGIHFLDLNSGEGTLIEIIGESFTSKAKPPRPVIIGLPHLPDTLNRFHKYFGFLVQPFNSTMKCSSRTKLLQLNALPALNCPDFTEWLDAEINWSFPLIVSDVIYANDEASKHLASTIRDKLKSKLITKNPIRLIAYDRLEKATDEPVTGVVIVSAVSRDGGVLREISRDLRSYIDSKVPRHFITPIGIPQTSASWKQLEVFLTKNPTSRNYGFSNWIQIPIGDDSEQNTWEKLATLAMKLDFEESSLLDSAKAEMVKRSLDLAASQIDATYCSFLDSPRGNALTLSEGFLFFAEDSEIANRYDQVSQSTLYLTISAVLQCAREHKDHKKKLCPTGYESVVLAPECFMRFNDAVLQACLLRACLPSELDYSASPELSKLMREFLSKVFMRCSQDFGDAALEFAAAIAVGSLRLTHNDMRDLLQEVLKRESGPSILLGLLTIAIKVNLKPPSP